MQIAKRKSKTILTIPIIYQAINLEQESSRFEIIRECFEQKIVSIKIKCKKKKLTQKE